MFSWKATTRLFFKQALDTLIDQTEDTGSSICIVTAASRMSIAFGTIGTTECLPAVLELRPTGDFSTRYPELLSRLRWRLHRARTEGA